MSLQLVCHNVPEHGVTWQGLFSSFAPLHCRPPFFGNFSTALHLTSIPSPQDVEHSLQSEKQDHWQSSTHSTTTLVFPKPVLHFPTSCHGSVVSRLLWYQNCRVVRYSSLPRRQFPQVGNSQTKLTRLRCLNKAH